MPVEDWLLRNWRVPAGVKKSADQVACHLQGQILQETQGMGEPCLKVGPSGSIGGGVPSYPSYQALPLATMRGTAPPVREFIHTEAPLLPQELWLSFVGEKGEVLPGDPKSHIDTSTDVHFYIEEIRASRATILGIERDRDTALSLAHKVAIWHTIMASVPTQACMHHPFLAMAVVLFASKGAYAQAIRGRTLPL